MAASIIPQLIKGLKNVDKTKLKNILESIVADAKPKPPKSKYYTPSIK